VQALRPDRCISSDLVRARETAEILGYPEPELDPAWREIDIGDWAGRLVTEVDQQQLFAWRSGEIDPPGGESRPAFLARVGAAIDGLAGSGGTVVVVTHGGCVRMACGHVTASDPDGFGPIPNASLSMFTFSRRARLSVLSWIADPQSGRPATDLASG
jgi:probable phosphoglycerate mutase